MDNNTSRQKINTKPIGVKPNISDKCDKIRLTSVIIVLKNVISVLRPCVTTKFGADQQLFKKSSVLIAPEPYFDKLTIDQSH